MLIYCEPEICLQSHEVAIQLPIGWTHAHWKIIVAVGNQSNLAKVVESVQVNVHVTVIPKPIYYSQIGIRLGYLWSAL
jgi:hypothetical protein